MQNFRIICRKFYCWAALRYYEDMIVDFQGNAYASNFCGRVCGWKLELKLREEEEENTSLNIISTNNSRFLNG